MRKDGAWDVLSLEKRQQLYALLPAPQEGDEPYNPDVNPLESILGPEIEDELRKWQDDLRAGRETRKWKDEAIQAANDRMSGKYVELSRPMKERGSGEGRDGKDDGTKNVKGENEH